MKVIGITGNIASGKSLLTNLIASTLKCKIFDADKIVHELYSKNQKIISAINDIVPEAISNLGIDRRILLFKILNDRLILTKIEKIVHPILCRELLSFLRQCRRNHVRIAILNIPLLFEIKANLLCNMILTLTVNRVVFDARIKSRYGSSNNFIARTQKKIINGVIKSGIEKFNLVRQLAKRLPLQ